MPPFLTTLAIETSTPVGSVGLQTAESPWQNEPFFSDRGHDCEIFLPLQRLSAVAEIGKIQQIIVGTGPGSYSGTRVGIAVAQGLSIVHHCPIVGLPSLLSMPSARLKSRCLAIGDARRGDWWWVWIDDGKMPEMPSMGNIEQLLEQVKCADRVISLDSIHHPSLVSVVTQETPSAHRLWQAWLDLSEQEKAAYASAVIQPLYLKPPHITPAKSRLL